MSKRLLPSVTRSRGTSLTVRAGQRRPVTGYP